MKKMLFRDKNKKRKERKGKIHVNNPCRRSVSLLASTKHPLYLLTLSIHPPMVNVENHPPLWLTALLGG